MWESTSVMSMTVAMNMYFLHKVARPRAVGSVCSDASLSKLQNRDGSDRFNQVAVFRLIPHGIQQAPNVHPVRSISRHAVLVATLEEKGI